MPGYVLVDITILDDEQYAEYRRLAAPTVAAFGGRYLVRGGAVTVLEGDRVPARTVVLEFPSVERARAWHASEEYAPARRIREACARTSMLVVEGYAG